MPSRWFEPRLALMAGAIIGMTATLSAHAAARCVGETATEFRTLRELPEAVRVLLPRDAHGLGGIAEQGQRFNSIDAIERDLPLQRFALAAVGTTCAVIAVEYGGIATHFGLTEYRLGKSGWQQSDHILIFRRPTSVAELLAWP